MAYLGIDPGFGKCGWGIIENKDQLTCLAYGCIETPPDLAYAKRYRLIEEALTRLILQYDPIAAGVELLFFGRNSTTAMRTSEARGVILALLERYKLPVYEPTPGQVKAEIGNGRAEKKEVQENIRLILGLDRIPKPDDAADGLAVALYVERNYRVEMMVSS